MYIYTYINIYTSIYVNIGEGYVLTIFINVNIGEGYVVTLVKEAMSKEEEDEFARNMIAYADIGMDFIKYLNEVCMHMMRLGSFCGAFCGAKACGAEPRKMPRKNIPQKFSTRIPAKIQTRTPIFLSAPGFWARPYYD